MVAARKKALRVAEDGFQVLLKTALKRGFAADRVVGENHVVAPNVEKQILPR